MRSKIMIACTCMLVGCTVNNQKDGWIVTGIRQNDPNITEYTVANNYTMMSSIKFTDSPGKFKIDDTVYLSKNK